MTRVRFARKAAPDGTNEDYFLHFGDLIGVLDGVTKPLGVDTGCAHGSAWYVAHLAKHLRRGAATTGLSDLLSEAIKQTCADHADCDLSNPSTPAAAVCLVRAKAEHLDYLVLCDAVLVMETTTGIEVITDTRLGQAMSRVPTESTARELAKRQLTNQPGGYWVAGARPEAAFHAITGSVPLSKLKRAALLTDGASRAVDTFGLLDWRGLLDLITEHGPAELIRRVRTAERAAPEVPRRKRHDDATVALCVFEGE